MPRVPWSPLLGATVALLTVLSFAAFGFEPEGFIAAFAAGAIAVLAAIDIEHRVLPNRIIFPVLAIVLVAQIAVAPDRAAEWLLAGPAAAAFLALPLLVRRDAMGMGDVKLAVLLGAVVGWKVFGAILVGCLAMLPFALLMLVRDGSIRDATLPFGPFLGFGTLLILLAS
jgi:leader peptidase (prepilin peptidase)/N-methyltransferase